MSYFPKIFTAAGLVMFLLGIIILGIGTNEEAKYSEGEALGAVIFVIGFIGVVVGLIALKVRRMEKKKMRTVAGKQARQKYAVHNDVSNGVSVITGEAVPDEIMYPRSKTSFTAIDTPDSGFTNLAAVIDDYHLPGSPYRQRRRESIEAQMNHIKAGSPRPSENPDVLVFPVPTSGLNPSKNKSHDGKNVKKSKSKRANSNLSPKLDGIPEIVVTDPSPRNSISIEQGVRSDSSSPIPNDSFDDSSVLQDDNSQESIRSRSEADKLSQDNKYNSSVQIGSQDCSISNDSWDSDDESGLNEVEKSV